MACFADPKNAGLGYGVDPYSSAFQATASITNSVTSMVASTKTAKEKRKSIEAIWRGKTNIARTEMRSSIQNDRRMSQFIPIIAVSAAIGLAFYAFAKRS